MTLRCAVLAATGAIGVVLCAGGARASDLTLALPSGPLVHALTDAFATPFSQATGVAVGVAAIDGSIDAAKAAHADVMAVDAAGLDAGCKSGTLQKLDWTAIGNRDRMLPGTASDCGEGAVLRGTVLAWNKEKFQGTPTWGEFWDVAKVPGKRGLWRGARTNLEIALLADGVAPSDVYSTLRDQAGVDRAFHKLDQLKPYLVWWSAPDEAPKLLESGDALMTSAPAEGIVAAQRGDGQTAHPMFALQWNGSLLTLTSWAAPAGGSKLALKFLAFAADPKNQRRLPAMGAYGGAASGSTDGLPAAQLAVSPSTPANLSGGLMVDEQFWRDNGAKLEKQFTAWLAKP